MKSVPVEMRKFPKKPYKLSKTFNLFYTSFPPTSLFVSITCYSGSNSTNCYAFLNFNHTSSATELNRTNATSITSDAYMNL